MKPGLDVMLFDLGDRFLAKTLTDKGEALLEKAGGSKADDDKASRRRRKI